MVLELHAKPARLAEIGGEGRAPRGMSTPKTKWGKPARGVKTRNNKRTDGMIVRRRDKR